MARKLKVFTTSAGFFDLAVSAPSMRAALDAWGAGANLFHQGFAQQTDDPAIVKATLARPGVVLRRPVGTDHPSGRKPRRRRRHSTARLQRNPKPPAGGESLFWRKRPIARKSAKPRVPSKRSGRAANAGSGRRRPNGARKRRGGIAPSPSRRRRWRRPRRAMRRPSRRSNRPARRWTRGQTARRAAGVARGRRSKRGCARRGCRVTCGQSDVGV